jgi:hypothetical protein
LTSLARLAVISGGSFTERTNDLTLGIARAQRDLSCVYTLGFYDSPELDRLRNVTIRVLRPGLRVLHAGAYLFRSPEGKRKTRLSAAFLLPQAFATGIVRTHVFPLRPLDRKRWEALLVISFPVPLTEVEETRDFGVVLTRKPSFQQSFSRSVTLRPMGPGPSASPTVTFVERVTLEAGLYEMTAVMSDTAAVQPHSARVTVEVPPIPRGELFLVRPVLGRQARENVVINAGRAEAAPGRRGKRGKAAPIADRVGSAGSFQPLLVAQLDQPQDLTVLTAACLVGSDAPPEVAIARHLRDGFGQIRGSLPILPLELEDSTGAGKVRCQSLVDLLPRGALGAGELVFEAAFEPAPAGDPEAIRATARFAVGP